MMMAGNIREKLGLIKGFMGLHGEREGGRDSLENAA
jgi:hypothetical protein